MDAVNEAMLAEQRIVEHYDCEECSEEYLFLMRNDEHEFSIGLRTILSCLAFAEKEGAIPGLPPEWWVNIQRRYS